MDPDHKKEYFSKKLSESQFNVLTPEEKEFVRNVSLSESSGETNEVMWEIAFIKALLQCVTRRVSGN